MSLSEEEYSIYKAFQDMSRSENLSTPSLLNNYGFNLLTPEWQEDMQKSFDKSIARGDSVMNALSNKLLVEEGGYNAISNIIAAEDMVPDPIAEGYTVDRIINEIL